MKTYKVLIVEDDRTIADTVRDHLEKWNFSITCVEDFKNVMKYVAEEKPDLILLDITLPFYNGFYWCKEIRKITRIPIVFLSSADDSMNIVMAMDMGGDDFIAKPFDLQVLTAKITAMLRRSYSFSGQVNALELGGLLLNLSDSVISYQDRSTELTKNEFRILQLLMENGGQMVSRDTIMMHLWESDSFIDDNTLTVNMTRLRKKLMELGLEDYIHTKKGMGYLIDRQG